MTITEQLKLRIKSAFDMDHVGIAKAGALANEPAGHRPTDILPGAKNVIVFGRALADGAVQALFRVFENKKDVARATYAAYASELAANFLLVDATNNIAQYIENTYDAIATPITFTVQQSMVWDTVPKPYFADPYGQGMPLNVWQAAMAAGLGEYGWSNRFLTPQDGPRVILSAVITTLDLDCDEPYSGEKLCDPEKCGICSKICPVGALPGYGTAESKCKCVEGKKCEVAPIKANSCTVAALGFRKEFYVRSKDLIEGNDPTDEEIGEALAKKPLALDASINHYARYLCDRCIVYCPVGNWKKKFFDRGLSTFDPEKEMVSSK